MRKKIRTYVYIDGLNLFNRSLKGSPYKWLDLSKLVHAYLKAPHDILLIKYFTTKVAELGDSQRPIRQDTYIRALKKHIPNLEDYYGRFLQNEKRALIAKPPPPPKKWVTVYDIREKGADVNLAVNLVNDAWLKKYDCAVVLSNDSDLAGAIKLVKDQHKKLVGLLIPYNCYPSIDLIGVVHFRKQIREPVLSLCQLPNPIPGTNLHKPLDW